MTIIKEIQNKTHVGYSAQHIRIAILPSKRKKKDSQMNNKKCSFKSVDLNFFRYSDHHFRHFVNYDESNKNNDQPLNLLNLTLHLFFHCHKNLDTPMFELLAYKPCILMYMHTYANTHKNMARI